MGGWGPARARGKGLHKDSRGAGVEVGVEAAGGRRVYRLQGGRWWRMEAGAGQTYQRLLASSRRLTAPQEGAGPDQSHLMEAGRVRGL